MSNSDKKTTWSNIGLLLVSVATVSLTLAVALCNVKESFTFEVSKEREQQMENDIAIGKQSSCGSGMVGYDGHFEMNKGNWPNRTDVPYFSTDDKESFEENYVGQQAKNLGLILFTMNGCGHCVNAKESLDNQGLTNYVNVMDAQNIERYGLQNQVRGFPAWYSPVTEKFAMGNIPVEKVIERLSDDKKKVEDASGVVQQTQQDKPDVIVLYVQAGCPYCEDAKQHIANNGFQNQVILKDSSELQYASPTLREQIHGFPAWAYGDNVQLGFSERMPFPVIRDNLRRKENFVEHDTTAWQTAINWSEGADPRVFLTTSCQHSQSFKELLATLYTSEDSIPEGMIKYVDTDNTDNPIDISVVPSIWNGNTENSVVVTGSKAINDVINEINEAVTAGAQGATDAEEETDDENDQETGNEKEHLDPQYYKYGAFMNNQDGKKFIYPSQISCGKQNENAEEPKEHYQPGVIQSGCPYKNPGGHVGIPSV